MNAIRKIQLMAAAVTANGLVLLGVLGPSVAAAGACNPVVVCEGYAVCQSQSQSVRNAICASHSTCPVSAATCAPAPSQCPSGTGGLVCIYT
jgi:hypothetical protein